MKRNCQDYTSEDLKSSYHLAEAGTSYSVELAPVAVQSELTATGSVPTSGPTDESTTFFRTFPRDYDVFREVSLDASRINNPQVRALVSQLLGILQRVLISNRSSIEDSGSLPPLKIGHLEDDAVLVEWIFKDFRIGFALEPPPEESSWYLITNRNLEEYSRGGPLVMSELEPLLSVLLGFALMNA